MQDDGDFFSNREGRFMKTFISFICIFLLALALPLEAVSNTFIDYQNYNHGYCPECNCYPCRCPTPPPNTAEKQPCATCPNGEEPTPDAVPGNPPTCNPCPKPDPCDPAPVCGTNCGISLWWVGLIIGGLAAAGAIIISSNNGSDPTH
jgi:hypothetical protein